MSKTKRANQNCPRCGAGPDRRVDTSGFGDVKTSNCENCGHQYEGEKE